MGIKYEVTAVTGTYKDREGNEKKEYQRIGIVAEGRNGLSLKLKSIPVGWDGWAYLNEPKPKEERQQRSSASNKAAAPDEFEDSDVPF